MNLLLRGNSSDENYNAEIDFVAVEVTPKLARLILKRATAFRAMKRKDDKALETYFWDGSATYLRYDKVEEKHANRINYDGFVRLPKPVDPESGENVECNQMVVDEDCVTFTAIPKHTSIYITSDRIPLGLIREVLTKKG